MDIARATDSKITGLTEAEAAERRRRFGANAIPEDGADSFLATVREILMEPMLLLLVAAAALYIAIGDLAEGLLLVAFALLTIGLVIYQQRRSENALAALRKLGAPSARVIRDGAERTVPASEIVPGDVVLIDEGERIPADGLLVRANQLVVDESLLTGESVPARKRASHGADLPGDPGGDDQPHVYSGTLAVRGHGVAAISDTGTRTRAGRIGLSLSSIIVEKTRLQASVGRIVRIFGGLSIVVCAALIVFYGVYRADWLQGVLSGIALAMAMLPEEFPVVLSIFLAIGAWRLAQIQVLARRPAVVETLGAATVLCVDKTGTLTENRMRIRTLEAETGSLEIDRNTGTVPEAFRKLVEAAWLATRRGSIDPMDQAVAGLATSTLNGGRSLHSEWPLAREYGLRPELLAMSVAWLDEDGHFVVATKGAPEAVISLCHLGEDEAAGIMARVHAMAEKGLRVLGVGIGRSVQAELPDDQHGFDFGFVGLVGFEDPLRQSVPAAVAEAARAGISVKMITGDFPATARAIAAAAGIDTSAGVVTGKQLEAADNDEVERLASQANVFARIMPEQKLRLVEALKRRGEIVAMTGDGVNDAPALKAAHIGIAMGARGTDVAREAAGIVLLDEDFGRIVAAVRMGRRIFENLRKTMIYISAIHVPIAGLTLLPLIAGMPPLLLPMHVVLIEMIIDPMCSIAFEGTPEERDIMDHPPRPVTDPLAGIAQISLGLAQGAALLATSFAVYWFSLREGLVVDQARTLAFVTVTAGNLALVRVNDTRRIALFHLFDGGHLVFWLIAVTAILIISICVLQPDLAGLFAFAAPDIRHAAIAAGTGLGTVLLFDLMKLVPGIRRIMGQI